MTRDAGGPAPGNGISGVPILVVDDDPASARLLAARLATEGADDVRVAHDAEEALVILANVPIRVLVVDIVLPRMSGLGLVRRIKGEPSTRGILAVAASGMDGRAIEREALDSGCAGFLHKPIDGEKLLQILSGSLASGAADGPDRGCES